MIQIILGIILLLIGVIVLKKYPLKKDVKMLSRCGLFVIIVIIMNRLSIMIPLFGLESFQIGFETLSIMLVGAIIPPGYAYLCALVIDFGGLLVVPSGFPFLGFTLNSVIQILIPSIWMHHQKEKSFMIPIGILKTILVALVIVTSTYFLSIGTIEVSGVEFTMFMKYKIIIIIILVIFIIFIFYALHKKEHQLSQEEIHAFSSWLTVVLLVELIVTMTLTPLWLDIMYGIPFFLSVFIRVLKACFMIPIDIFVGYKLYKILHKL
ncbi:folate family ECF transporter S component [Tannockella kyphosi]|uniref:folate family ECF transporter S component n=1 Tax=Tannockella kyphosi TaxID=2899121 RepID=UPI002012AA2F|nr:folate family ECF transporter S component [Tannockella kyphosi]